MTAETAAREAAAAVRFDTKVVVVLTEGTENSPLVREPVMVMSADSTLLGKARAKASAREDVTRAIYTRELFATGHDEANRAAVAAVRSADPDLVGIAVRGPRNAVDRVVKGARFHD